MIWTSFQPNGFTIIFHLDYSQLLITMINIIMFKFCSKSINYSDLDYEIEAKRCESGEA